MVYNAPYKYKASHSETWLFEDCGRSTPTCVHCVVCLSELIEGSWLVEGVPLSLCVSAAGLFTLKGLA